LRASSPSHRTPCLLARKADRLREGRMYTLRHGTHHVDLSRARQLRPISFRRIRRRHDRLVLDHFHPPELPPPDATSPTWAGSAKLSVCHRLSKIAPMVRVLDTVPSLRSALSMDHTSGLAPIRVAELVPAMLDSRRFSFPSRTFQHLSNMIEPRTAAHRRTSGPGDLMMSISDARNDQKLRNIGRAAETHDDSSRRIHQDCRLLSTSGMASQYPARVTSHRGSSGRLMKAPICGAIIERHGFSSP